MLKVSGYFPNHSTRLNWIPLNSTSNNPCPDRGPCPDHGFDDGWNELFVNAGLLSRSSTGQ